MIEAIWEILNNAEFGVDTEPKTLLFKSYEIPIDCDKSTRKELFTFATNSIFRKKRYFACLTQSKIIHKEFVQEVGQCT